MKSYFQKFFSRENIWFQAYFYFWSVYFGFFYSRLLYFNDKGDAVVTHAKVWGDWAMHFIMGSVMGYRKLFITESPLLLGSPFSYPFLCNLFPAVLIRWGVSFFDAFLFSSFMASVFFMVCLFLFFKVLFKSQKLALLCSLIFIFNGGTGFFLFLQDLYSSGNLWATLLNPPHVYTQNSELGIFWISIIEGMLIPQRSFQLGFPFAVLALILVIKGLNLLGDFTGEKNIPPIRWKYLMGAVIILGLMPLLHTFSMLGVFIVLFFWCVGNLFYLGRNFFKNQWKGWLFLGGGTTILALPILKLFILSNINRSGFIRYHFGWLYDKTDLNWLQFWWNNMGLSLVLGTLGMGAWVFYKKTNPQKYNQLLLMLPFFFIFFLVNFVLFAPWAWDNNKLLAWAHLGISGLAGFGIYNFFLKKDIPLFFFPKGIKLNFLKKMKISLWDRRIIGIFLFFLTIFSGAIDTLAIFTRYSKSTLYTNSDLKLASWVLKNTSPDSIWLTGPVHNHWLTNLTGRQGIMTFDGWLWTHGYDYTRIKADIKDMYETPDKDNLFEEYGVDYVVVGHHENSRYKISVGFFEKNFKKVLTNHNTTLYQVNDF